jgi:glyoxylase-like metal-dependent hydrolase (beta-lactamase superfamily II)
MPQVSSQALIGRTLSTRRRQGTMKTRTFDYIDEQKNVIVIYDKMFPLYIIKGQNNFLIDSGVTTRSHESYENISRVLAATSGEGSGIHNLLLTHSHWDHVGGSFYLQSKFGFDVFASARTVELLQKPKVIHTIDRLNQKYKKMVSDTSDRVFDQLTDLHQLHEGDRIPVDKECYFEVFLVPGHTKCSTAYLLQPQKILFPGDSVGVVERDRSIKPMFLSSYTNYVQSLEKLLLLEAEVLCFSHNRLIKGKERVNTYLKDSLNRAVEVKDEIIAILQDCDDVPQIAKLLLRSLFSNPTLTGPEEAMLINFEAMIKSVQKECL